MLHLRSIASVVALCFAVGVAQGLTPLEERVEEAGAGWMIGTWTGQSEEGSSFTQSFTWDLNKNVILSHWKGEDMETKGMILVDPVEDEVRFGGSSNQGGMLLGVWTPENDSMLFSLTAFSPEGETWKADILYRKSGDKTMEVSVYPLDDTGSRPSEPAMKTELKKK